VVDAAQALQRLHPDEDVLGDAQVGEERRLLEDDRDARGLRLLGVVEDRLLPVEHEPPRIGPVDAGEDLDEGRLAGAVLPDEAVHLTREELDVAVHERPHGAEALLCMLQREQWFRMCGGAQDARVERGRSGPAADRRSFRKRIAAPPFRPRS
jgi:hypothetical protein